MSPYVLPCHTHQQPTKSQQAIVRFVDAVYSSRSRICRLGQCAASTVNPCRPVYIKDALAKEYRFLDLVSSVGQMKSIVSN